MGPCSIHMYAYVYTHAPICMATFSPNCGTMILTSTPSESMVQTPNTDMSSPRVTCSQPTIMCMCMCSMCVYGGSGLSAPVRRRRCVMVYAWIIISSK